MGLNTLGIQGIYSWVLRPPPIFTGFRVNIEGANPPPQAHLHLTPTTLPAASFLHLAASLGNLAYSRTSRGSAWHARTDRQLLQALAARRQVGERQGRTTHNRYLRVFTFGLNT